MPPSGVVVILLCGIPSEEPLALVATELERLGHRFLMLNQREMGSFEGDLQVHAGEVHGWLRYRDRTWSLADFTGIYARPMDDSCLPETRAGLDPALALGRSLARQDWLLRWWNLSQAAVVNRPQAMLSNQSKAWQLQVLRRHGFSIPATLITNSPDSVREFRRRFGRVIYKSASSVRSIVQELRGDDDGKLDRIRWCPTQFQEYVPGRNIRVHVVGDRCLATEAVTEAVDYRYASSQVGSPAVLEATTLPAELERRCVAATEALGLAFSGLDLKLTDAGRVVCFEANPSPGYSYYENATGQPIAAAVAGLLAGLESRDGTRGTLPAPTPAHAAPRV